MTNPVNKSVELDRSGRLAIIGLSLIESLLLLLAHDGIEANRGLFASALGRTLWYSLGIALPLLAALLLNSARDVYAAAVTAACAVLLLPLAWHTGAACALQDAVTCSPVFVPYVWALAAALFVLLPYLQAGRVHGLRPPYADLFHHAWDNLLTLAAALLFTGAGWLILLLWAGLFGLIGIDFFRELFEERHFIYPVTGLYAGFGLMLARSQQRALQSVLRICLALGRALLPLIAILAVAFLVALMFTGLQPLWETRRAATLLLALILFVALLVNAAFQDGDGPAPAGMLRQLVGAALLTLPAYALIALYALYLRVAQYGWTVDRLWAVWAVSVAGLYAGAYAVAAFGGTTWLARMAPANRLLALPFAVSLLLTQSPVLDFRAITIQSQLGRWERGDVSLDAVDFEHLRWELGQVGIEALQGLAADPRVKADAGAAQRIEQLLASKNRWEVQARWRLAAEHVKILPQGTPLPEGLLQALSSPQGDFNAEPCGQKTLSCTLLAVDLNGDRQSEWVFANTQGWAQLPVFALREGQWRQIGQLHANDYPRAVEVLQTLGQQAIVAETPPWKDLRIGGLRFEFQSREP